MNRAQDYYPESPEALIVNLARGGDRLAFEELVRRHQSNIRNLMRRLSRDRHLADDLAQQTFLRAWTSIRSLRDAKAFAGWLKKIAVSMWLQHLRKHDVMLRSEELFDAALSERTTPGMALDLDAALTALPEPVRLVIVLAYQEGMSHSEISESTGIALGTVKSHIRRGSEKLKFMLQSYRDDTTAEKNHD